MELRLLFPSEFIAAADLDGREVTLTVAALNIGEPLRVEGGAKTKKHVVSFAEMIAREKAGKGENKRWVLNKTNAKTIAKLYGTETDDWIGKRITLFPTTCQMKGETVDCIRVKATAPAPRKPAAAPASKPGAVEDWELAIDQADGEESLRLSLEQIGTDKRLAPAQAAKLRERAGALAEENGWDIAPDAGQEG